ncbi:MAG TPA: VOC family protein [Steroidobacteraceae bacterium]|nr:VOC family protein [Steroidobacteraceae bacterium]
MSTSVRPFLMFQGSAEAALRFYVELFPDGKLLELTRYAAGEAGREGSVARAAFSVGGQTIRCIDSPVAHAFSFTPATSLFVECDSEPLIERLWSGLAVGGTVLMPLASYPFSRRFGWLNDRFGVSWQLSLTGSAASHGESA